MPIRAIRLIRSSSTFPLSHLHTFPPIRLPTYKSPFPEYWHALGYFIPRNFTYHSRVAVLLTGLWDWFLQARFFTGIAVKNTQNIRFELTAPFLW